MIGSLVPSEPTSLDFRVKVTSIFSTQSWPPFYLFLYLAPTSLSLSRAPLICMCLTVFVTHGFKQMKPKCRILQWVKKLSQCLAISERVVCNKSNKLHKNVKIIYVIV